MESTNDSTVGHEPLQQVDSGLPKIATPEHDGTVSPPFWNSHGRSISNVSYQSIHLNIAPITLEDHSEEYDEQGKACWARNATVDDYVVVSGPTGIGAYIVWSCTVETLKGGPFTIRKRYSEFDELRINLVRAFPHSAASIPELPRKSVICKLQRTLRLWHALKASSTI